MIVDVPDDALQYLQFEPVEGTEVPDIPSLPPARLVAIYEGNRPVRVILRATDAAVEEGYLDRFADELRIFFRFVSQDEFLRLAAESDDEPLELGELGEVYAALSRAEVLLSRQSRHYDDLREHLHGLMARVRERVENDVAVEYGPFLDDREVIAIEFDVVNPTDEVYGIHFVIDPSIPANGPLHLYSQYSSSGWATLHVLKTQGDKVVAYLIPDDISANDAAHDVSGQRTFSYNNAVPTDFNVHVYPGPTDAVYRMWGLKTVDVKGKPDSIVR